MDTVTSSLIQTLHLPRLSTGKAQALSLVALHGVSLRLALPTKAGDQETDPDQDPDQKQGWLLDLSAGVSESLRQAASHCVCLSWAGAVLRLCATPGALLAWVNTQAPGIGLDTLPHALQQAALEAAIDQVLRAVAPLESIPPLRIQQDQIAMTLPNVWTFSARSWPAGELALMVLEADDLGLMLLARLLKQLNPVVSPCIDEASLPVRLRAQLGLAVLPLGELRSLASADVILLDEYWVDAQGELWLCTDSGYAVRVCAEQSSYRVTQGWTTLMKTDAPMPLEQDGPAGATTFDDLPVTLSFDLGDRVLSLAELRQLQPGAVFDLQRPLQDGPVMIRANGALLGTGSLVDIDGRIGVCIASLGKVQA